MNTTSLSLLANLRRPDDNAAWNRFVELYTPLLFYWCRRAGLQDSDAADLVQDVLQLLVKKLPEFEHDRTHSFRSWLRTVTLNKWREQWRKRQPQPLGDGQDGALEAVVPDGAEQFWEAEYRQMLAGRALEIMRAEFEPATWQACWETVVRDRAAAEVAQELGISVNAVYLARSRVLRRLREELDGLWE
jgi:RNA polymerase sigma-70 factor (ECF subfamily)